MIPVSPVTPNEKTQEVMAAESQPEYQSMPIVPLNDGTVILSRWELTDEDLETLREHRSVWLYQFTFGRALQPCRLETEQPILTFDGEEEVWPGELEVVEESNHERV